jgi:hypothetical protein
LVEIIPIPLLNNGVRYAMTSMTSLSTRRFLNGWGTIFVSDVALISNRTQCEKLRTISYDVADLPLSLSEVRLLPSALAHGIMGSRSSTVQDEDIMHSSPTSSLLDVLEKCRANLWQWAG